MNMLILLRVAALFSIFLFGLAFGSFLNVLIYRLPREMSPLKGFSMCPKCTRRLMPVDLVPVLSWISIKGRCRYCKEPVSPVYPAVEILNGLLWVAVALHFGRTIETVAYMVVVSCLLGVFVSDLQTMIIPDSFPVAIAAAGIVLAVFSGSMPLTERLIGAVCVSGAMLVTVLVSKGRAMGGGDVKLMAALGLCIGWKQILAVLIIGAVAGSLTFVVLSRTENKMGRLVPFGAFLTLGGIVCVLIGPEIIAWYLGFFHTHEYYHTHTQLFFG